MTEPAPPRRRSRRLQWIIGGSIVALLVAVGAVSVPLLLAQQRHAAAETAYEEASADYNAALADAREAVDAFDGAKEAALDTRTLADEVLAAGDPAYVDPVTFGQLATAALALAESLDVPDAAPEEPARLGAAPEETGALERRAREISEQVDELRGAEEQFTALAEGIESAVSPVTLAGEAFMASLAASAAVVDGEFISATNTTRISYREIVEEMPQGEWADGAAEAVASFVATAAALAASHGAEEAEKAGPLYANRKAVEEFARSLSGGVMLDFDWAPIVNGYGLDGGYGGTATWNTAHGGYSTITLSDSVASQWQSNSAVASLVAHEVGHSITGKCIDLFRDGFDSQAEVFATAWAIGLGYDQDGSGESIYGRPSPELIQLSKQCR